MFFVRYYQHIYHFQNQERFIQRRHILSWGWSLSSGHRYRGISPSAMFPTILGYLDYQDPILQYTDMISFAPIFQTARNSRAIAGVTNTQLKQ